VFDRDVFHTRHFFLFRQPPLDAVQEHDVLVIVRRDAPPRSADAEAAFDLLASPR
jgi:hypothetical protein